MPLAWEIKSSLVLHVSAYTANLNKHILERYDEYSVLRLFVSNYIQIFEPCCILQAGCAWYYKCIPKPYKAHTNVVLLNNNGLQSVLYIRMFH